MLRFTPINLSKGILNILYIDLLRLTPIKETFEVSKFLIDCLVSRRLIIVPMLALVPIFSTTPLCLVPQDKCWDLAWFSIGFQKHPQLLQTGLFTIDGVLLVLLTLKQFV